MWSCIRFFYLWFIVKGSRLLFIVGGVVIIVQVVTVAIDVSFRNSPWQSPFGGGSLELLEILMAMLAVLILSYTWLLGGHIRIDMLRVKVSPRKGAVLDVFSGLCGIVYTAAVAWGLMDEALYSLDLELKTDMLNLPIAPFQIAFTVLFLHFSLVLITFTAKSAYHIIRPLSSKEGMNWHG